MTDTSSKAGTAERTVTGHRTDGTQSMQRAIAVLREIATGAPQGLRLSEIAHWLGIERATAHRILNGLAFNGLVHHDRQTRRYKLGFTTYQLGLSAAPHFTLQEICEPALFRLAKATGDSVFLLVRSGFDAVCLARAEGSYPIRTHSLDIGARRPLGAGAGSLALLAQLPDPDVERSLAVNSRRLDRYHRLDAERLRVLVKKARQAGYSHNDEGVIAGVSAIGVAIPHSSGIPYVALSAACITSRMVSTHRTELFEALSSEVALLSQKLDGLPMPWDKPMD